MPGAAFTPARIAGRWARPRRDVCASDRPCGLGSSINAPLTETVRDDHDSPGNRKSAKTILLSNHIGSAGHGPLKRAGSAGVGGIQSGEGPVGHWTIRDGQA